MKIFIVLGMHRSATSLIAKALHTMKQSPSVYMGGNLLGPSKSNPHGHFENSKFISLNDEILRAAGGSWDMPPTEESILALEPMFKKKIKALLATESNGRTYWGWKDPRTTLTIKLFLPYLINPHFICSFRNPIDVAKSLKKRNNMDLSKGLSLAHEYNQRLINFLNDYDQMYQ